MKKAYFVFRSVLAVVFSCITALAASLGTFMGATDGTPIMAQSRDYCFDNDRLLIGGYNYAMAYADAQHVQYVKDADIDFLITGVNEDFLNLCDSYGIGVIAKSYNARYYNGTPELEQEWLKINPDNFKDHACLWGDDVIDEPNSALFSSIGNITRHYYANTTGKLPLVNLFPMYANAKQLGNSSDVPEFISSAFSYFDAAKVQVNQYKKHVSDYVNNIDTDFICVDIYPLTSPDKGTTLTTLTSWLRNLDILSEACRETNRDLWVITQAAGNMLDTEDGTMRHCDTADDIRWQAYVSMAFGAKAIIHACYSGGWWDNSSHLIDSNGERTATYYAAQTVDAELQAIAETYGRYHNEGAYLHNKYSAAGIDGDAFLMPVDEQLKPAIVSGNPLLIGCFTENSGKGTAYTFVNMIEPQKNKTATATVTFEDAAKITVYDKGKSWTVDGETVELSLAQREGVFVTVE